MSIASHFLCAVRSNIDIKNKSEPLDVHEVVRICSVWRANLKLN